MKILKTFSICFLILVLLSVACIGCVKLLFDDTFARTYETSDIDDYGKIIGNYDNAAPKGFITSFFPSEIENHFSDVVYHYKAKKYDTYAYEVWLEFVIEDPERFAEFIEINVKESETVQFPYDASFQEYTISNVLFINNDITNNADSKYLIENAQLGKILYSVSDQRIIFWALGVYDGGGTDTTELNRFFDYFHIDPVEFSANTDHYANVVS